MGHSSLADSAPGDSAWVSPWGKLAHDARGAVVAVQSLRHHSADVAAVLRALLSLEGIARRLSTLAGRELDATTLERLAYLAFLHDCGKVNSGFQARVDPRSPFVGHIKPLAALFGRAPDPALARAGYHAIGGESLSRWGAGAADLLDAVFSHHGNPWPADEPGAGQARYWRPLGGRDPIEELRDLRLDADANCPLALSPDAPVLPAAPRFVHAFAGLMQLADWIASSDWQRDRHAESTVDWAHRQLRSIGLDPAPWRSRRSTATSTFVQLFGYCPFDAQTLTQGAQGRLVLLESETGSGKTEAALYRFTRLFADGLVDGLYFALPTRTAAAQIHARVGDLLARMWGATPPPFVLAVPGYLDDSLDGALPNAFDPLDSAEADARRGRTWAAEHPKRYFTALVSVGTIDQALLSAVRAKHAHLRAASLMRHLLVVDEVHASDAYMRGLLLQLLKDHLAAGGHALLLSATLGAEVRDAYLTAAGDTRVADLPPVSFDAAIARPYPVVTTSEGRAVTDLVVRGIGREKRVQMHEVATIEDAAAIAARALSTARAGAKVLVVRNSVAGAVRVQSALERLCEHDAGVLFHLAGRPALHHGRFAREDRRALDDAVEAQLGKTRPSGGLVLVGTQTLEQSLDIDADVLITDLCPADVLLQRIGRLHRHAREVGTGEGKRAPSFGEATAYVLSPRDGLRPLLSPRRRGERHGLGFSLVHGELRGVYPDLTVAETTRRLLTLYPEWRIPAMNRVLVERALHSSAIAQLLASMPEAERADWHRHRIEVEGHTIALGQVARDSVLRRDEPFMEQGGTSDEFIATRLGARDRLVELPASTRGPFGWNVRRIAVPSWMVRDVPADATPRITPNEAALGFDLEWDGVVLQYDRFGLRPKEVRT